MRHQDHQQRQQQQQQQPHQHQNQHDSSHSPQDHQLQTHILVAHSWLFILLVAPLTIALLIWLLVLLVRRQRRRRRQDEKRAQTLHRSLALVSEGCEDYATSELQQTKCNINPPESSYTKDNETTSKHRNRSKKTTNAADQLLLDLTTSSSATSTNTSASSAASTVQAGCTHHDRKRTNHLEPDQEHVQDQRLKLAQIRALSAWSRNIRAYRALIDHTNCYMLTLTSHEILACLVAFSLAILNIIRTRNLFTCNLVIFILIATKLLSLLSLTTFTFAKLVRLLRLRPPPVTCVATLPTATATATTTSSHYNHRQDPNRKLQFPAVILPVNSRAASRAPHLRLDIIDCISEESSLDPQSLSVHNLTPKGCACAGVCEHQHTDDQQATISRLLINSSRGKDARSQQSSGDGRAKPCSSRPADEFARSPSNQLLMSALRALEGNADMTTTTTTSTGKDKLRAEDYLSEKKRDRASSLVLALLSSSLALFCLYTRLVGVPADQQVSQQQRHANLMTALNRNLTDWAISISSYPTTTLSATGASGSTTTEASTRYESTPSSEGLFNETTGSAGGIHLVAESQVASLSAIQQTTSQLRHLIDAHELHTFAQLLLDTQLQTSRFSCSLSSGNYAPLARSTMLTIYLALMAFVLLASLAIQQAGRQKMKQISLVSQMRPETAIATTTSSGATTATAGPKRMQVSAGCAQVFLRSTTNDDDEIERLSHGAEARQAAAAATSGRDHPYSAIYQRRASTFIRLGSMSGSHGFASINSNSNSKNSKSKGKNKQNQGHQNSACVTRTARLHHASRIASTAANQEHQELEQDLKLTKSIILFAQLLNHGPVLLLLAIGTFLPDGIVGGSAQRQVDDLREEPAAGAEATSNGGWTSVHDNAFAWLMLVEALAWPLFLCASDTQIAHAFRRSLRASSCTPPPPPSPPLPPQSSATAAQVAHGSSGIGNRRATQTSRLSLASGDGGDSADFKQKQWPLQFAGQQQQQLHRFNQSSAAATAAATSGLLRKPPHHSLQQINLAGSRLDLSKHHAAATSGDSPYRRTRATGPKQSNYLLGPSSTYPNFMFAFGGVSGAGQHGAGGRQPRPLGRASFATRRGTDDGIYSQPPANGQRVALAGELGLLTTTANDDLRLEIASGHNQLSSPTYDHLYATAGDQTTVNVTCWPPVMEKNLSQPSYANRKSAGNLLIDVGRRLFKLGRPGRRYRRERRRLSSGAFSSTRGQFGTGTSTNTYLQDGSAERKDHQHHHQPATKKMRRSSELSPTSSLSTLIRKFNHDNYTSVCKQYENHNIIISQSNQNRLLLDVDGSLKFGNNSGEAKEKGNERSQSRPAGCKSTSTDEIISIGGITCATPTTNSPLAASCPPVERICARKGGLAYEFSLGGDRVNPMLARNMTASGGSDGGGDGARKQNSLEAVKQVAPNSRLTSNLLAASDKMDRLLELDVAAATPSSKQLPADEGGKQVSRATEGTTPTAGSGSGWPTAQDRKQRPLVASQSANDNKLELGARQMSAPKQTTNDEQRRPKIPPNGSGIARPLVVSANLPQVAGTTDSTAVATKPHNHQDKQTTATAVESQQANNNNYLNQMQLRLQQFEDDEAAAADAVTYLDYATLRSLADDALSLVSVSSEFEYHDIQRMGAPFPQSSLVVAGGGGGAGAGGCTKVTAESKPVDVGRNEQANGRVEAPARQPAKSRNQVTDDENQAPRARKSPTEGTTSNSNQHNQSAANIRQANDLRFPSFLATQPPPAIHQPLTSSSSSSQPNRRQSTSQSNLAATGNAAASGSGPRGRGAVRAATRQPKMSSSLLELTAAKYAGGATKPVAAVATNSRTITKSRSGQKSSQSPVVQFGEFNRRSSSSSAALTSANRNATGHMHENGNVRARIMRMEQQQQQQQQQQRRIEMTGRHHQQVSSPNLTNLQLGADRRAAAMSSSNHSNSHSSSNSSTSTASMIPVLASSSAARHKPAR